MRAITLALAFALSSWICVAQSVSLGVVAGGRATSGLTGAATDESKRYVAGPMLDIALPLGLGAEVDALYSREGYSEYGSGFNGIEYGRERANAWQFPILAKYRLPLPLLKPYVMGGYVARVMNGTLSEQGATNVNPFTGAGTPFNLHLNEHLPESNGVVVGAGVQANIGRLRLMPQIRYTWWTSSPIIGATESGGAYSSAQSEVTVLLGIGWKVF